jgi:hypothetical protein
MPDPFSDAGRGIGGGLVDSLDIRQCVPYPISHRMETHSLYDG